MRASLCSAVAFNYSHILCNMDIIFSPKFFRTKLCLAGQKTVVVVTVEGRWRRETQSPGARITLTGHCRKRRRLEQLFKDFQILIYTLVTFKQAWTINRLNLVQSNVLSGWSGKFSHLQSSLFEFAWRALTPKKPNYLVELAWSSLKL